MQRPKPPNQEVGFSFPEYIIGLVLGFIVGFMVGFLEMKVR